MPDTKSPIETILKVCDQVDNSKRVEIRVENEVPFSFASGVTFPGKPAYEKIQCMEVSAKTVTSLTKALREISVKANKLAICVDFMLRTENDLPADKSPDELFTWEMTLENVAEARNELKAAIADALTNKGE